MVRVASTSLLLGGLWGSRRWRPCAAAAVRRVVAALMLTESRPPSSWQTAAAQLIRKGRSERERQREWESGNDCVDEQVSVCVVAPPTPRTTQAQANFEVLQSATVSVQGGRQGEKVRVNNDRFPAQISSKPWQNITRCADGEQAAEFACLGKIETGISSLPHETDATTKAPPITEALFFKQLQAWFLLIYREVMLSDRQTQPASPTQSSKSFTSRPD